MKINLLSIFLVALSVNYSAQVGINTNPPHPSAALDMSDSKRGFLPPRVVLSPTSENPFNPITNPADGLLVYNKTASTSFPAKYYYKYGTSWIPFGNGNETYNNATALGISASTLGYAPRILSSAAEIPASLNVSGVISTKSKCVAYSGHTYCSFNLNNGVTWEQAFNIGKSYGGYLPVITTNDEWNFIKTNLLDGTGNSNHDSWIGFNYVPYKGNAGAYTWITAEKSMVSWATSSSETNFATNQPAAYDSSGNVVPTTPGCIKIANSTTNSNRQWYKDNCINTANFDFLIIEFHNN